MSPLLFALQTDFDIIWLNCTEEQIEQVHIIYFCIRDATLAKACVYVKQSVLCAVCSILNDADGF